MTAISRFALGLLLLQVGCMCGAPGDTANGGDDDSAGDADADADGDADSDGDGDTDSDDTPTDGAEWGVGTDEPFDPQDDNSSGVTTNPEGALILDGEASSLHVIWIPNSAESTISKVDTRLREVLGRYQTGPGGGHSPSRTAVDFAGDVVVANRAFSGQASLTRILAQDCVDQDGDGEIETSTGNSDLLAWDSDECVAWRTEIGCADEIFSDCGVGRAVAAVDIAGLDGVFDHRVWGGLFNEKRFVELDRDTGEPTGRDAQFVTVTPYGAAVARDLNIWVASFSAGKVGRFDATDPDDTEEIDSGSYGITVDEEGYVWIGGGLRQYDPEEGSFVPLGAGQVGCYGVAADGFGATWAADENNGLIHRVMRDDPTDVLTVDLEAEMGMRARGIAIDFDGFVWIFALDKTFAAVIDPITCDGGGCEIEKVLDDCDGVGCLNNPYNYSDMTGLQLHNATNPHGTYEVVLEGCDAVDWLDLEWDAVIPAGTSVSFRVRTAADLAGLAAAPWVTVASAPPDEPPASVGDALDAAGLSHERYLGIEASLRSEVDGTPILRSFSVTRNCPPVFE